MASSKPKVVIVGSGNIAQYIVEEFINDASNDVVVISRTRRAFLERPEVDFYEIKEYSKSAILSILDSTNATAVISTLQSPDPTWYNTVHESILFACRDSKTCKRLVSSEYMGNLRDYWYLPRGNYYVRQPFRLTLARQSDVKWTLVNQGWLGDYFVQPADGSKSYIRPFPNGWPIDLEQKTVRITGTGDEPIGWTAARDMAKAVVKLISREDWPDHTYVFGELSTWNIAIEKLENFLGRKLKVSVICCTLRTFDTDIIQADSSN